MEHALLAYDMSAAATSSSVTEAQILSLMLAAQLPIFGGGWGEVRGGEGRGGGSVQPHGASPDRGLSL